MIGGPEGEARLPRRANGVTDFVSFYLFDQFKGVRNSAKEYEICRAKIPLKRHRPLRV